MKTYHVIRNMAIDKDHAIEISETFLSKERAEQAAEHLTKFEEKDFKVEEVEEDLIVDDGIALQSYVTLNYSNGVEVHAGLTDKQKQLLAEQPPMQSEKDVQFTMGVMGAMNLLNAMG